MMVDRKAPLVYRPGRRLAAVARRSRVRIRACDDRRGAALPCCSNRLQRVRRRCARRTPIERYNRSRARRSVSASRCCSRAATVARIFNASRLSGLPRWRCGRRALRRRQIVAAADWRVRLGAVSTHPSAPYPPPYAAFSAVFSTEFSTGLAGACFVSAEADVETVCCAGASAATAGGTGGGLRGRAALRTSVERRTQAPHRRSDSDRRDDVLRFTLPDTAMGGCRSAESLLWMKPRYTADATTSTDTPSVTGLTHSAARRARLRGLPYRVVTARIRVSAREEGASISRRGRRAGRGSACE